jgi:hypothetical protein
VTVLRATSIQATELSRRPTSVTRRHPPADIKVMTG